MPELHAHAHDYSLAALLRLDRDEIDYPTEYILIVEDVILLLQDGTPILLESGAWIEEQESGGHVTQETSDDILVEASSGLILSYKLTGQNHDYILTALAKLPPSPVFVVVEGNLLMEDASALLQETGDHIIYSDIRGN